jgi:hypothetical protein
VVPAVGCCAGAGQAARIPSDRVSKAIRDMRVSLMKADGGANGLKKPRSESGRKVLVLD